MLPSVLLNAAVAMATLELRFSAGPPSADFNFSESLVSRMLRRDANSSPETELMLTPAYNFYYAKVHVGTPSQELELLLDTGSPITWVYGPNITYNDAPQFFPDKSSSYKAYDYPLRASYGSGQYLGSWGEDTFVVPAATYEKAKQNASTVKNFAFGLVEDYAAAAGAPGLLGLGLHWDSAGPKNYTTLPEALYNQKITESPAFSVFLNGSEGTLIFGGWDLNLIEWPIYGFKSIQTGKENFYRVPLNHLALDHKKYDVMSTAMLDTGSPMSLVPPGFVKQIGQKFNLTAYSKYGTYYTTKQHADLLQGWVTFNIGLFEIDVPVQDLFVPGKYIWMNDGPQDVMALSLLGSPNYLLGDVFFRHVYTVFDSGNNMIYLSRRRQNIEPSSSEIVPFSEDIDYIPGELNNSGADTNNTTYVVEYVTVTQSRPVYANIYRGPHFDKKLAVETTGDASGAASATAAASATGAASSAAAQSTSSSAASSSENAATGTGLSGVVSALLLLLYI